MIEGVWLMFDTTIHYETYRDLSARGVDCIHAGEEGLSEADALALLESAIEDGCILVSRNYADFTRLADAFRQQSRAFPGVLLLGDEFPAWDSGLQADAIQRWLTTADPSDHEGRCSWLSDPGQLDPGLADPGLVEPV